MSDPGITREADVLNAALEDDRNYLGLGQSVLADKAGEALDDLAAYALAEHTAREEAEAALEAERKVSECLARTLAVDMAEAECPDGSPHPSAADWIARARAAVEAAARAVKDTAPAIP